MGGQPWHEASSRTSTVQFVRMARTVRIARSRLAPLAPLADEIPGRQPVAPAGSGETFTPAPLPPSAIALRSFEQSGLTWVGHSPTAWPCGREPRESSSGGCLVLGGAGATAPKMAAARLRSDAGAADREWPLVCVRTRARRIASGGRSSRSRAPLLGLPGLPGPLSPFARAAAAHRVSVRGVTPCVARAAQWLVVSDCAACVTGCEEQAGGGGGCAAAGVRRALLDVLRSMGESR